VASLSQGRTAAAQCGLFTHKSVPVIFEPPCIMWTSAYTCWLCCDFSDQYGNKSVDDRPSFFWSDPVVLWHYFL